MKDPVLIRLIIQGIQDQEFIKNDFPLKQTSQFLAVSKNRLIVFLIINNLVKKEDIDYIIFEFFDYRKQQYVNVSQILDRSSNLLKFTDDYFLGDAKDLKVKILLALSYNKVIQINQHMEMYEQDKEKLLIQYEQGKRENEQMKNIMQKVYQELEKINKPPAKQQSYEKPKLHIAILYSNPIVRGDMNNIQHVPGIGYYKEIEGIRENMYKSERKVSYQISLATSENLYRTLSQDPTILHIICHGDYNSQKGTFYLAFEKNGRMQPMYQDELSKTFTDNQLKHKGLKLVILSCCHSGEIAQVLQSSGVPYVIAVSAEYKIEDKLSIVYSRNLYHNLLCNGTLKTSHQYSQEAAALEVGEFVYTCCCAHQHDTLCRFDQIRVNEKGYHDMHELHTPLCDCKFKKNLWHNWGFKPCDWAKSFIEKLYPEFFTDENEDELFKLIEAKDGRNYLKVCCCELAQLLAKQENIKDYEHNESKKFQIFTSNESDKQIFEDIPLGQPEQLQAFEMENIFIIGRHQEFFNLYTYITDNHQRPIIVAGQKGSGKSKLVDQCIKYVKVYYFVYYKERDRQLSINFQQMCKFIFLKLRQVKNAHDFHQAMYEMLNIQKQEDNSELIFDQLAQNKSSASGCKYIFVFEDCDELIKNNSQFFIHFVSRMVQKGVISIQTQEQTINYSSSFYHIIDLQELQPNFAFELLHNQLSELTQVTENDFHLIKQNIQLYPQNLQELIDFQRAYNSKGTAIAMRFNVGLKQFLDKKQIQ